MLHFIVWCGFVTGVVLWLVFIIIVWFMDFARLVALLSYIIILSTKCTFACCLACVDIILYMDNTPRCA